MMARGIRADSDRSHSAPAQLKQLGRVSAIEGKAYIPVQWAVLGGHLDCNIILKD